MRSRAASLAVTCMLSLAPATLFAQQPRDSVTLAANPQYRASGFKRFFLGGNWRELWTTPLRVPVLDLETFAGGLTPVERGGGNQSITLHMEDAEGREWIFRSIDKFPEQGLPDAFNGAPAGAMVKDQISAQHPAAHFVLPRLLDAIDVLHVDPEIYVLPDHPSLGEFRETFAGMLGELEIIPNEGPDDTPGFAGSRKIKGTEEFFNDLEDSPAYRLEEREYLRARLVDMIVGDADRTADNWRWARYGEEGDWVYRPLPRDRDWAFMDAEALIMALVRATYPKLTTYGPRPSLHALTYGTHLLDRRLLTRLTRDDFAAAADAVQGALTDGVIDAAARDVPPEYVPLNAGEIASVMKARRDLLDDLAADFYRWLASEVDVRATDEDDLALIEVRGDGSVRVRLSPAEEAAIVDDGDDGQLGDVFYDRVFLPSETGEVRVYLHGGEDRAIVTGSDAEAIRVRVIGGGGDDALEDRTGVARFYDHRGDNEIDATGGTVVSTTEWEDMDPPEGLRLGHDWVPDWGGDSGLGPTFDYSEGAGVIVGLSHARTGYGFRHHPYEWTAEVSALYATTSSDFGVRGEMDYRFENSRMGIGVSAEAIQFHAFRFYGLGNDTPELEDAQTLVMQDRFTVFPALSWTLGPLPFRPGEGGEEEEEEEEGRERPFGEVGRSRPFAGRLTVGPHVMWTSPRVPEASPLSEVEPEPFGQAGGLAILEVAKTDRPAAPRKGFRARASASAYPGIWTAPDAFGDVAAELAAYLPLLGGTHVALRGGGERVWGDFPAFESAFVGGRGTLRGYRWNRFAGDASAYGTAELRVPLGTLELFFKGELGVFGLADAGRVWVDGESAGGWNTGYGGGLWFATLGKAISAAWVQGERGRAYVWLGLPF